jgi:Domain of unknown function (DUF4383)
VTRLPSPVALGGAALLLVGVLGFVPAATTHYGALRFGHGSDADLLGVFRVSILLNLVHIVVGAAGIAVGRTRSLALASLVLWLIGVFAAGGWLSLDTADNWLHFLFAVALLGLALLVGGKDLADDLERDLGGSLPAQV